MKGFHQVEEDWVDFLDYAITHPTSTVCHFRKPIDMINDMGYSECLYYFIAMVRDVDCWYLPDLEEQLGLSNQQLDDIYEAYSLPINYVEPVDAYLTSPNDYYKVEQDFWNGELQNAWKVGKVNEWLNLGL